MSNTEVQAASMPTPAGSMPSEGGVWARDLPVGSRGYVGDHAVTLGADVADYSPQFSGLTKVYDSPSDERNAMLTRVGNTSFTFDLPPGQSWADRSSFQVILVAPAF